ncbi:DUF3631 domain-containing protein [Paraburkholderia guartelaensis]|uniref:DUF3631 domain-containing protein n=1 Tax=Paraburkholderia guartelaensis TaxID=2546446 RepID=UPI002AB625F5|nr:DUF3631 domain-containing protein [Paraburkholderia guartelaensis]
MNDHGHDRDAEMAFAAVLAEHGFTAPEEIVADGKFHRFDGPDDRRGQRNAWYVLHADSVPAGAFGDWKNGTTGKWHGQPEKALTKADRKVASERIKAAHAAADAERARQHASAAASARRIWARSRDADANNGYCRRKGVKPYGLKVDDRRDVLLVPLYSAAGELANVQFIYPTGGKRFKAGGEVAGCSYCFGGEPHEDGVVMIGEGYATCASAYASSGYPAVVAFNAGNLLPVARTWRAKLPHAKIVMLADDDHRTQGNPGLTKAQAAARAVGGVVAVPDFGEDRADDASDFNDLQRHAGIAAVRERIETALDGVIDLSGPQTAPAMDSATVSRADGCAESADAASDGNVAYDACDDEAAIALLATMDLMQYDRVRRAEAKRLGVQASTLDRLVAAVRERAGGDADLFAEVEPWPEPVDGAALLDEIATTIRSFVVCDVQTAHAAALWIVMTWLMDAVNVAPLLVITSPEMRCGKSQLLALIGRLVYRCLTAGNISPPAVFRTIEKFAPTLLLDECDTFMRENEEMRGLLNCGHTRDSAFVIRTVGDDFTPRRFSLWGAKALAGIGKLANTLTDRAIVLPMRRKLPHERVEKLRHAGENLFDTLSAKIARWTDDNREAVRAARPALPEALNDRAADNWEPLFQIAGVAGGAWPQIAQRAALHLSGEGGEVQGIGGELLAAIRAVFDTLKAQRIFMARLLDELCRDEEAPWATWNKGHAVTARQLGRMLAAYGISSKPVRIDNAVAKGYEREQFADAFARYLCSSPESPVSSVTRLQPNTGGGLSVTEGIFEASEKNASVTPKPLLDKACNRVTDGTGEESRKVTGGATAKGIDREGGEL